MPTGSLSLGNGSLSHNNRTQKKKKDLNYNPKLSHLNITMLDVPLRQVYHNLFDVAQEKYNKKQTRKSRQIPDYYEKVKKAKQLKTVYEVVIGISNIETTPRFSEAEKIHVECLMEYAKEWEKRNPNFEPVQKIIHMDEKGVPHLHLAFVPYSTDNKRGMEIQNSMAGALKQMGFPATKSGPALPPVDENGVPLEGVKSSETSTGFMKWRVREMEVLGNIMRSHGLELEKGSGRQWHLHHTDYKAHLEDVKAVDNYLKNKNELEAKNQELKEENQFLEQANERASAAITAAEGAEAREIQAEQKATLLARQNSALSLAVEEKRGDLLQLTQQTQETRETLNHLNERKAAAKTDVDELIRKCEELRVKADAEMAALKASIEKLESNLPSIDYSKVIKKTGFLFNKANDTDTEIAVPEPVLRQLEAQAQALEPTKKRAKAWEKKAKILEELPDINAQKAADYDRLKSEHNSNQMLITDLQKKVDAERSLKDEMIADAREEERALSKQQISSLKTENSKLKEENSLLKKTVAALQTKYKNAVQKLDMLMNLVVTKWGKLQDAVNDLFQSTKIQDAGDRENLMDLCSDMTDLDEQNQMKEKEEKQREWDFDLDI